LTDGALQRIRRRARIAPRIGRVVESVTDVGNDTEVRFPSVESFHRSEPICRR
jgi:hypothetical protein